jgi:hypothetical protein
VVAGTAQRPYSAKRYLTHPIEYGVLLTMVLPIAITFALKSPTRRWLYRAIVGAIAFAVFLSISRSAMLCAGVALLVLAVSWTPVARSGSAAHLFCGRWTRLPHRARRARYDNPAIHRSL